MNSATCKFGHPLEYAAQPCKTCRIPVICSRGHERPGYWKDCHECSAEDDRIRAAVEMFAELTRAQVSDGDKPLSINDLRMIARKVAIELFFLPVIAMIVHLVSPDWRLQGPITRFDGLCLLLLVAMRLWAFRKNS